MEEVFVVFDPNPPWFSKPGVLVFNGGSAQHLTTTLARWKGVPSYKTKNPFTQESGPAQHLS